MAKLKMKEQNESIYSYVTLDEPILWDSQCIIQISLPSHSILKIYPQVQV